MNINRRQFLTALMATPLFLPMAGFSDGKTRNTSPRSVTYFSARMDDDGHYHLSAFDALGQHRFSVPLPDRGHSLAIQADLNHVVAVARRPETFLLVVDGETGEIIHQHESHSGRHFYGHGCFSADGRWLYTTENNLDSGNGVIGVRDVYQGYQQVAEFPSHGIGPHQLELLNDGQTLVVANGGIMTRPETGRVKLNIDSMSPSLVYIDSKSGDLLEQQILPKALHKNSIRHLAVNAHDRVCIGFQYQGDPTEQPPLVGLHQRGQAIRLLQAPDDVLKRMRNYCGSVCSDLSNEWFAVTSPKGNLVTFWSAHDGKYIGNVDIDDGCGVAAGSICGEFLLSSGSGGLYRYRIGQQQLQDMSQPTYESTHWDNHMVRFML